MSPSTPGQASYVAALESKTHAFATESAKRGVKPNGIACAAIAYVRNPAERRRVAALVPAPSRTRGDLLRSANGPVIMNKGTSQHNLTIRTRLTRKGGAWIARRSMD